MICIGTFIDLLKTTFPDANTIEILTFYGGLAAGLGGVINWYRKRHITTHPFKMEFFDKTDNGKICISTEKNIEGIHGLFPNHFKIRIKLKKERNFEHINIRLVEKNAALEFWDTKIYLTK